MHEIFENEKKTISPRCVGDRDEVECSSMTCETSRSREKPWRPQTGQVKITTRKRSQLCIWSPWYASS